MWYATGKIPFPWLTQFVARSGVVLGKQIRSPFSFPVQ
jgi:hypothetical protein